MNLSPKLLAVLLLVTAAARAEPTATGDNTAKARALFQSGLTLAQQGDLAAALREFEAAYAARPHFSVLYNIGQARATLGRPVEAVAAFERYLADGGKQVSEARREEVQALIATNRARIGRLRVLGGTPTTRVWLDGLELSAEARRDVIAVAKGEHSLTFWNGSGAPQSQTASLTTDATLDVTLPEPAPAGVEAPALAPLTISCDVPDVEVQVLGFGSIKTPQARPWSVPVGQVSLRFSRVGYPTLTRNVLTVPGELTQINCEERPISPVPPQLAARLNLTLEPTDAEVSIDGQRYSGGTIVSGLHLLQIQRDGFVPIARRISLEAGRTQLLEISLAPNARERERVERARARSRSTALVLGGLGLGVLAAGVGVYSWNSSRYDGWQAKRASGAATPEDAARIQRADDAAWGLLIVGGALGVGSAWVFFSSP